MMFQNLNDVNFETFAVFIDTEQEVESGSMYTE